MSDDNKLQTLAVTIEARTRSFEKSLERIEKQTSGAFAKVERDAKKGIAGLEKALASADKRMAAFGANMGKSFLPNIGGMAAGLGAVLGARELQRLADTWTDLTSRVNLAVGSMDGGTQAMSRLSAMARRTYSSLEQTTESFVSNSTALKELGYATNQQLDFTEALNNALVISGAKAERAATIQNALSKAMAGGKLAGQNLNTVLEQGGRVAEALAAGMGVGVNQLRKLGAEGKITSNEIVRSLTSQMEKLRAEAESMPATISDGLQLLQNSMLEYVGNADKATGISAKISEALVIMADNFDKTADVALQLAGVLAGGLLGRSVINMIRQLGLGAAALTNFTKALATARSMATLSSSFAGLGAAAGPVGMLLGGAVAGALVYMSAQSLEAEARVKSLTSDFEEMGLISRDAAEGVEAAAESIDNLSDADRVRKIKQINEELDRMRGGGGAFSLGDEFGSIAEKARAKTRGLVGLLGTSGTDSAAYTQIAKIAEAVSKGDMAAQKALETLRQIRETDVSQPVIDLIEELEKSTKWFRTTQLGAEALGDTSGIDNLTAQIGDAREELAALGSAWPTSKKTFAGIDQVIADFVELGGSADDAKAKIAAIAGTNINANAIVSKLNTLIDGLARLRSEATSTAAELAKVVGGNLLAGDDDRATRSATDPYIIERKAAAAYEAEAKRRNSLTKDQLALENEIAKVRTDSLKEGVKLTEKQIELIAKDNLAADKARSGEKSTRKTREKISEYDALTKRIENATTAQLAETAALRGLNPLLEDHGYTLEKARTEVELLLAAQQSGRPVTEATVQQIQRLAHGYAEAVAAASQLADEQEAIREAAAQTGDLIRDAIGGALEAVFESGANSSDRFFDHVMKGFAGIGKSFARISLADFYSKMEQVK